MQEEIEDSGELLDEIFGPIYHPKKNDPGREWPPKIRGTVKYARSSTPVRSAFHFNFIQLGEAKVGPYGGCNPCFNLYLAPNRITRMRGVIPIGLDGNAVYEFIVLQ